MENPSEKYVLSSANPTDYSESENPSCPRLHSNRRNVVVVVAGPIAVAS